MQQDFPPLSALQSSRCWRGTSASIPLACPSLTARTASAHEPELSTRQKLLVEAGHPLRSLRREELREEQEVPGLLRRPCPKNPRGITNPGARVTRLMWEGAVGLPAAQILPAKKCSELLLSHQRNTRATFEMLAPEQDSTPACSLTLNQFRHGKLRPASPSDRELLAPGAHVQRGARAASGGAADGGWNSTHSVTAFRTATAHGRQSSSTFPRLFQHSSRQSLLALTQVKRDVPAAAPADSC